MKNRSNFIDSEGRVESWPSKIEMKKEILKYLGTKFEYGRYYTEREVNELLTQWHTFNDFFMLRRGLVDFQILKRRRDGSRYWKGDFLSPEETVSETLKLRPVQPEDKQTIWEIEQSCAEYGHYSKKPFTPAEIDKIIDQSDLPPDGNSEFFSSKLIIKDTVPVGLCCFYSGYPTGGSLYISWLIIKKEFQRTGIASQVTAYISDKAKSAGFCDIQLGVLTENIPGLKYWVKQGFSSIRGVYDYEDTGKHVLGLIKGL